MELLFTMVVPLTIAGVALYGLGRGVDAVSYTHLNRLN